MMSREQLAQWMEDGLRNKSFRESQSRYILWDEETGTALGCALGAALVGKMKSAKAACHVYAKRKKGPVVNGSPLFAVILDISPELAQAIDQAHWNDKPAWQIAAELREQAV